METGDQNSWPQTAVVFTYIFVTGRLYRFKSLIIGSKRETIELSFLTSVYTMSYRTVARFDWLFQSH